MFTRLCAIVLVSICISAAPAPKVQEEFRLKREDLIRSDSTLVVKLSVVVPKVKAAEMTKLVFRWHDKVNHSVGNGMWEQTGKEQRADIVVVAQVASGTKEHPPMLMLSTQQKSKSIAYTFQAHPLSADSNVADVVEVDVKDGEYPVGERLKVGTVGGEALYLSVESFPAD
jgi:hypothetical protein